MYDRECVYKTPRWVVSLLLRMSFETTTCHMIDLYSVDRVGIDNSDDMCLCSIRQPGPVAGLCSCVVMMAVRTRNSKAQGAVEHGTNRKDGGANKRQKVSEGVIHVDSCHIDKDNAVESLQGNNGTPDARKVHEDDIIFIRKRMSATRKHHMRAGLDRMNTKQGEERIKSPDDVLRLPRSMPTDDDCNDTGEGKMHHARRKTKSRVDSEQDPWLRKYPTDSSSPGVHDKRVDINSIPDSCLVNIFKLSMADTGCCSTAADWKKNPCLSVFPLVCQRWKRVLCSPSELWNTIGISQSLKRPDALRQWILKRQPSIQGVNFFAGEPTNQTDGVCDFIECLGAPVTHQWQKLELDCALIDEMCVEKIMIDASTRLSNIHSLSMYGVKTLTKSTMEALQSLSRLEALSIRFSRTNPQVDPFQEEDCSMSESLFKLTNLKSLTLDGKGIKDIPPTIARLKNLSELNLESIVQVQKIPLMAVHLNNLTKLSFKGSKSLFENPSGTNGSTSLDDPASMVPGTERMFWMIRSLPKLEELNIDDCGIKEIPIIEGLPVNTSLKRLSMNDNPDMVFKKGLGAFQGLETLTMRRCNMPCVSSAVTALTNLKYLDISNNGLVECNGLGKLKCLDVLKASHNQFPSIPRDIYLISGLKELELHGCIYLEFSFSLIFLAQTWPKLHRMVVTKGSRGRYQARSLHWLQELQGYLDSQGRTNVVQVDNN